MSDGEDDFGDFDDFEEFVEEQPDSNVQYEEQLVPSNTSTTKIDSDLAPKLKRSLHETDFSNSAQLQTTILEILDIRATDASSTNLMPSSSLPSPSSETQESRRDFTETEKTSKTTAAPTPKSYFSERSESLWNQLAVMAPEVHPIDWKRSSIRRLLLVSLGVPLDLDEILPKKNTKRLILPSRETGSKGKSVGADAHSASGSDTSTSASGTGTSTSSSDKKKQVVIDELVRETERNLSNWYQLAGISATAVEGMDEKELESHVEALRAANNEAKLLSNRWEQQKEVAQKDKEAFESVIESLVEYAQRLRR